VRSRNLTAVLGAIVALTAIIPAAASASLNDEIWLGSKVEQIATHRYRGFDFVAACNQVGRRSYWCDVSGTRGHCFEQGHAEGRITHYDRTGRSWWTIGLRSMNRTCF
jgi:hypothetical protein